MLSVTAMIEPDGGDNGYPAAVITIKNQGKDIITGISFSGVLINHFGHDYSLQRVALQDLEPNGEQVLRYGDWTDMALTHCELTYFAQTEESKKHVAHLLWTRKLVASQSPDFKRDNAWHGAYDELVAFARKGEVNVEFLTFDWREKGSGNSPIVPLRDRIPFSYRRFVVSRWYEFVTPEYLAPIIKHFRQKNVLILGKDTGDGLLRMKAIAEAVKGNGYAPILVKEVSEIRIQSSEEKVLALAMMCRFVVVEDSEASGHIGELALLSRSRLVIAVMRLQNCGGTFMQVDYGVDFPATVKIWNYDQHSVGMQTKSAVEWAELALEQRAQAFDRCYPWRKP